jgi:hypothetical protein
MAGWSRSLRSRPRLAVGAILLLAVLVVALALLLLRGGGSDEDGLSAELRSDPTVASFLASEAFPDDVKQRFVAALADGGLDPSMLPLATDSWRAISEKRCVGTIVSIDGDEIVLKRVADGEERSIGIAARTVAGRGGEPIPASELRPGEFAEALSEDGMTADIIINYSQRVERE